MDDALLIHRIHFGFTVTFHYLFPQLTMGLALLILILKSLYLRTRDPLYNRAARFWARIFGINFVMGVVTGIPMEFQFGANWVEFSRVTGGVIGYQTGATLICTLLIVMEGYCIPQPMLTAVTAPVTVRVLVMAKVTPGPPAVVRPAPPPACGP